MKNGCIQINLNEQDVFHKIIHEILRNEVNGYWYLLFISGVLKKGNILTLEEDVEKSKFGKKVDADFLLDLASDVNDLQDLLLINTDNKNEYLNYKSPIDELYSLPLIMVELFDSTYWRVCSSKNNHIQNLKKIFEDKCNVDMLI